MDIQAYFEDWSRRPGDTVRMAISTAQPSLRASVVRLVSGPGTSDRPEGKVVERLDILDRRVAGRRQDTVVGSHAVLPLPTALDTQSLAVHCWIWPTNAGKDGVQTVWSLGDLALALADGRFHLLVGGHSVATIEQPIVGRHWYSVAASIGAGEASLDIYRPDAKVGKRQKGAGATRTATNADALQLACNGIETNGSPRNPFDGKIESPTIHARALSSEAVTALHAGKDIAPGPIAAWLVGQDFGSDAVASAIAGAPAGKLFNGAERGVTGHNWDGTSDSFVEKPHQYRAVQFHHDDMVQSGWEYDLEFTLPKDLQSGVYAVRLEAEGSRNVFPLFVMGAVEAKAPVLYVLPTNTYLAYGNDHLASLDFSSVMPHEKVVPADETYLFSHPEPGRSCYDTHADGTPVRYSSRRRPLFNVRPGFPNWLTGSYRHFPVDMYTVEWLEHVGLDYHIATDEDLEREGRALLDRYNVVITGSHPEYWTRIGLDSLDDWLNNGGRLMYLGGNGFYWVTSRVPDKPWIIEVRRDNSGTRCWDAPYGERTHVATIEAGGIWRSRGRAPNKTVGVGFASEGWSKGCGYRRLPASYEGPAARFFEGLNEEIVGDYGHVLGGAVGDEVDRYDEALGSPEHAFVLGTSTGLGNEYQLVIEDLTLSLPDQGGAQRPDVVRSDMVMFPIDGGGAVFSVGSITYAGALAWNDCNNGLSRLTANILKAFASPEPVFGHGASR